MKRIYIIYILLKIEITSASMNVIFLSNILWNLQGIRK